MHPTILKAWQKAQANVEELLNPNERDLKLEAELKKLKKHELIEYILELKQAPTEKVTIESIAYAILEDPECAWLDWETVSEVIKHNVPECKASIGSLRWYGTQGKHKGKDVVLRKTSKEIAELAKQ